MGQDMVAMKEVGAEWGSVPGSPSRILMGKEIRDTTGLLPILHSIPKDTESVYSSFRRGVSKCFSQVNIYFLLALVTWKHKGGIVPLALDPTEVAHRWA